MKRTCCTIICLTALALNSALSQQPPAPRPGPVAPAPTPGSSTFSERVQNIIQRASEPGPAPVLTKFDLDFPGGTPGELVAAIQKAMGRSLNAIVPKELADTKLPALKMNSVDVSELFQALIRASQKQEAVGSPRDPRGGFGGQSYQIANTSCGFRQGSEGRPTDNTIWYFYVEKPTLPPLISSAKVCRYYSLVPYLDRGLSVDDITTAIETGWKMLGDTSPSTISFHKDTKLLIAVGEPSKLETIDAVLKALEPSTAPREGRTGRLVRPGTVTPAPTPTPPGKKAEGPEADK